jgi:hypothetical protein
MTLELASIFLGEFTHEVEVTPLVRCIHGGAN